MRHNDRGRGEQAERGRQQVEPRQVPLTEGQDENCRDAEETDWPKDPHPEPDGGPNRLTDLLPQRRDLLLARLAHLPSRFPGPLSVPSGLLLAPGGAPTPPAGDTAPARPATYPYNSREHGRGGAPAGDSYNLNIPSTAAPAECRLSEVVCWRRCRLEGTGSGPGNREAEDSLGPVLGSTPIEGSRPSGRLPRWVAMLARHRGWGRGKGVTMEAIDALINLLPTPKQPVETADEGRWEEVERQLGSKLPTDYRAFCRTYGSGVLNYVADYDLDHSAYIFNPLAVGYEELLESQLQHLRRRHSTPVTVEGGDWVIYPLAFPVFPAVGGLFPLGKEGVIFDLYFRTGEQPEDWVVFVEDSLREGHVGGLTGAYDVGLAEWLVMGCRQVLDQGHQVGYEPKPLQQILRDRC